MFRYLFLLFFLACVLAVPAFAVHRGIDKVAAVGGGAAATIRDLDGAEALLRRFDPRRMPANQLTTVTVSAQELNAAIRASLQGVGDVTSRIDIDPGGVKGLVSVRLPLPESPIGRYVNLRATVAPSETGLRITNLSVGRLHVPQRLIPHVLRHALDGVIGKGKGRAVMSSVRTVRIQDQTVAVAFYPVPSLADDIRAAALGAGATSHPDTVRAYYQRLVETDRPGPGGRVSLAAFIGPLFALARERSLTRDPAEENRALIMALAMYFGDPRFEHLIGAVRSEQMKARPPRTGHVRLGGRHDFVQHFAVSAGVTAAGGTGAANLAGEIKEVRDSQGGSGFSFTDIAADRAGVRFAERATASPEAARLFQNLLAGGAAEEIFFPRVADLPENLSRAAFTRRFGDIDSAAYRRVIDEIDRRMAALALYR